jgi:predicted RNase H-like HicB family nuclease
VPRKHIDLRAYRIRVTGETALGFAATVDELPGCVAAAPTIRTLERRIEEAIVIYLDEHPDAPRHLQR